MKLEGRLQHLDMQASQQPWRITVGRSVLVEGWMMGIWCKIAIRTESKLTCQGNRLLSQRGIRLFVVRSDQVFISVLMQLLMNCDHGIFHGSPACDDMPTMNETRFQGIHYRRFTFARFHQNEAAEAKVEQFAPQLDRAFYPLPFYFHVIPQRVRSLFGQTSKTSWKTIDQIPNSFAVGSRL